MALGFLLVIGLVWLCLAIAVASHAGANGRSGAAWGIITFFLGVFGLIGYAAMVLTDDGGGAETATSPGPKDARLVRSGSRAYCSACSTRVDFETERCGTCGARF